MTPRRIMVVEDEMMVQLHLTRIVQELGHELVGAAADMDEALEVAAEHRPELVLMDIHLASGSDGVETARRLVKEIECAVIFISAYADEQTVDRTEGIGAAGYLVKPFTATQVRAAIATAFASHARWERERSQAQSLSRVLERIGGALFLVDSEDHVTFANQSAADLVGWPVYKVFGRDVFAVLGTETGDTSLRQALEQSRRGEHADCMALQVHDKDGLGLKVDVTLEFIPGEDGAKCSVLLSLSETGAGQTSEDGQGARVELPKVPFGAGTRLMVYSHDTFGLGHLRRCMALIRVLCARNPKLSVLLVTGSPMVHRYSMPPGADYVKLPALQKVGAEDYEARTLQISGSDIRALRSNLILHTARDYKPNVLLVDHSPTGGRGELVPTLDWLRERGGCVRILGLRDVIDDPLEVQALWRDHNIYEVLERNYDHVAVYGDRHFYDPVREYAFTEEVAARTTFVGFVCSAEGDQPEPFTVSENDQPLVFVTIGGGDGGGDTVIVPFLQMMRDFADRIDFRAEIVTGPFVGPELRARLEELSAGLPVVLHEFVQSTQNLLRTAEVVISTAGYNTATDLLSFAQRSILIPRVMYRQEQTIRAQRFGEMDLCTFMHPDNVTPQSLFETIQQARSDDGLMRAREQGLPLHGTTRFAEFCSELMVAQTQG